MEPKREASEFAKDREAVREHLRQGGTLRTAREDGAVTRKARDKVCPGCGGKSGAHIRLECAYWADEVRRADRKLRADIDKVQDPRLRRELREAL